MERFFSSSQINRCAWSFFAALCAIMLPEIATASPMEATLCSITDQLTGPIGRGVGAVAVIFLGFGLFMGKVTWGLGLAVGLGIGCIFGAPEIVDLLGGDASTCP